MKIIITEEQYHDLVTKLLDLLLGDITIKTVKEKREGGYRVDYHSVFNEDGDEVITIWVKGNLRSKGCKKDLTLEKRLINKFEQYMPYYRHKMFSKVLVDYIYDKFGIKCDCVQYDHTFEKKRFIDSDGDEYVNYSSKTKRYNVKKKKKIKESYDKAKNFLKDNFGFDFSGRIEQITSTYDVPMSFDDGIDPSTINMFLNHLGPMYLFELDGVKYLYQDRGDHEWFINEEGYDYVDNEIPEQLGIAEMGFTFSDILDMYFEED